MTAGVEENIKWFQEKERIIKSNGPQESQIRQKRGRCGLQQDLPERGKVARRNSWVIQQEDSDGQRNAKKPN